MECAKCGYDRLIGPRYDDAKDMLKYTCPNCGYSFWGEPLGHEGNPMTAEFIRAAAKRLEESLKEKGD